MFRDKEYITGLARIALPIIAQNFVSSLLNMIDVAMIGQLGETAIAAVGQAGQVFFMMLLMLFGINGGVGVFVAQLWGKRDVANIRKAQGIGLSMGLAASTFFFVTALAVPGLLLRIFSPEQDVIIAGSEYLRIIAWSYIPTAITFSYSATLRGVGLVRIPMAVSITAISLKTLLNYLLIFGNFGFPALGIEGAAIATVIARVLEVLALLMIVYLRRLPPAATVAELLGFRRVFLNQVLKTSLPVVINETLWALGTVTYNIVYGHIGKEAYAAVQIAASIEGLAFVIFIGISEASGILIGNRIGASQEDTAFEYARRSLTIATVGAIGMGFIIYLLSTFMLNFYQISEIAQLHARNILHVMAFALWVKVTNLMLIVGILRAGGDTRFGLFLDAGSVWLVGVPLAVVGAFVFHLPVSGVYMLVICEEAVKLGIALWRFFSRRWITNLAQSVG